MPIGPPLDASVPETLLHPGRVRPGDPAAPASPPAYKALLEAGALGLCCDSAPPPALQPLSSQHLLHQVALRAPQTTCNVTECTALTFPAVPKLSLTVVLKGGVRSQPHPGVSGHFYAGAAPAAPSLSRPWHCLPVRAGVLHNAPQCELLPPQGQVRADVYLHGDVSLSPRA